MRNCAYIIVVVACFWQHFVQEINAHNFQEQIQHLRSGNGYQQQSQSSQYTVHYNQPLPHHWSIQNGFIPNEVGPEFLQPDLDQGHITYVDVANPFDIGSQYQHQIYYATDNGVDYYGLQSQAQDGLTQQQEQSLTGYKNRRFMDQSLATTRESNEQLNNPGQRRAYDNARNSHLQMRTCAGFQCYNAKQFSEKQSQPRAQERQPNHNQLTLPVKYDAPTPKEEQRQRELYDERQQEHQIFTSPAKYYDSGEEPEKVQRQRQEELHYNVPEKNIITQTDISHYYIPITKDQNQLFCQGTQCSAPDIRQEIGQSRHGVASGPHAPLPQMRIISPKPVNDENIQSRNSYCPNGFFGLMTDPTDSSKFIDCSLTKAVQNSRNCSSNLGKFCKGKPDGIHAHPFECTKFITCTYGRLYETECAIKTDFDGVSCNHKYNVPCNRKSVEQLSDGKLFKALPSLENIKCLQGLDGVFPSPFNNRLYFKCFDGKMFKRTCGKGKFFSLSRKLCDINEYERSFDTALPSDLVLSKPFQKRDVQYQRKRRNSNASTGVNVIKCPQNMKGNFIHPFFNTNYVKCFDGVTEIERCLNGAIFSRHERKCIPCNDEISVNDGGIGYAMEKNRHNEVSDENLGVFCGPESKGYYPHPTNWRKYVICHKGVVTVNLCPKNKIFDIDLEKCVEYENKI
uniref:Chitin-binding type-2 domain-containing protein n=1 Tax=Stomoxys calcitrans TaxID=35570 RepID=A0A1I8PSX3_STOCA